MMYSYVMRHVDRSFRYGPRLTVTVPLAIGFSAVTAEMVALALTTGSGWRYGFVVVGIVTATIALTMLREIVVRLRGKRQVVVRARELVLPDGRAVAFRDMRALELRGAGGFQRVLHVRHAAGELEVSGVMLGKVSDLDELHGLINAAQKLRR